MQQYNCANVYVVNIAQSTLSIISGEEFDHGYILYNLKIFSVVYHVMRQIPPHITEWPVSRMRRSSDITNITSGSVLHSSFKHFASISQGYNRTSYLLCHMLHLSGICGKCGRLANFKC